MIWFSIIHVVFPTSYPSNLAELQLYRVMQNASLLYYYDTLLEMGGDDVQQLCDAGEEEFLEIMSLVGMASKPLHVRRLQKSLQEWAVFTFDGPSCPPSSSSSPGNNNTSLQLTPTLLETQIAKLAKAAERLSKQLPQFEPKPYNTKKKMSKELELVMSMPENDPRRMDEIRRYAAIYGRLDCKRRPEKPLTLHEVSVNEAAAQICRFVPVLLTRRDELFPLARQVVKDSGCHYSKTQVSSTYISRLSMCDKEMLPETSSNSRNSSKVNQNSVDADGNISKRPKLENDDSNDPGLNRQEKESDNLLLTRSPLHSLFQLHSKSHQLQLPRDLVRNTSLADFEEVDSHYSYSNSSSPYQGGHHDQDNTYADNNGPRALEDQSGSEVEDNNKYSPKIIAASGDSIIAVANPALAMSPTILASGSRENR
ncbi:hypothetical protein FQA39_LY15238 [Lamprigera yunnana]|nr:hypothetical protein FQA39_LY15238 [Lamprigera yunnana]